MENKIDYQAEIFANRLKKKNKELRKWARKNRITCYRLYNKDIPEIPLSIDLYEFLPDDITTKTESALFLNRQNTELSLNNQQIEKEIKSRSYVILNLYERPYKKEEKEEEIWLSKMEEKIAEVLEIPSNHIISKYRKQQKGLNQYEKIENSFEIKGLIQEFGQIFKINLTSYLDTGLFLDHRPLRKEIRNISKNKKVLNLFCYTGSFSVYAAEGLAKSVESVDLSNTYLTWTKENLLLNNFKDENKFIFTKSDVIKFLKDKIEQKDKEFYDLIILDPPTFSNSKSTQNILDINKDWVKLCCDCLKLLSEKGILFFSTNSTRLSFKPELLSDNLKEFNLEIEDITSFSIPKDFESSKCHKCYKISRK